MKNNISPEEKLLKLIRADKKPIAAPLTTEAEKAPTATTKEISIPLKEKNITLNPNYYQIIFIVLAIIAIVYLGYAFFYPNLEPKSAKLIKEIGNSEQKQEIAAKEEIKPYEFYLEGIASRQIFARPSIQQQETQEQKSTVAEESSIKDMNLVGIISGDNPQAMIEDKKAQKTYSVSKGQLIGEFEVTDIQEGRVTLKNKDQKFELSI